MANVEPIAPIIDFELLLTPIEGENPSGEAMAYSGLYDEIREARRFDDTSVSYGEWQTDLKVADYRKVIDLSISALSSKTKDLQICVWLTEALTGQHGFAGFRDGLQLCHRLEEDFWDSLYPEIDEGDMEARANSIDWMNRDISLMLKKVPITLGDGFNYNNWEESTRFDIPENLETLEYEEQKKFQALSAQAEQENRKTGDQWRKAKNAGNRAFYETLNLTLDECYTALNELDRVNEEKFDRNQVPGVSDLKKTLGNIITVVAKVLEEKRQLEPDEEELIEEVTEEVGEDGELVVVKKGAGVATGAIQSRQDALKRLSDVAVYFRKNEPHSPVSYLIQRAVKWGSMPLELWFQDVIKDDSVIEQLRQTLGFNTGESSDSSESSDY
ncbi:MAG: type VI secretion system protein TssA [Acidobacteriota bacterium]